MNRNLIDKIFVDFLFLKYLSTDNYHSFEEKEINQNNKLDYGKIVINLSKKNYVKNIININYIFILNLFIMFFLKKSIDLLFSKIFKSKNSKVFA